jgi:hypothetical protein
MREPDSDAAFDASPPVNSNLDDEHADFEAVLTTAADVESAGRSCLAIVVLATVILALLLLWIVVRSTAGG